MFGLDTIAGVAGGLAGGGGGPSSARGSQDGNTLGSGTAGSVLGSGAPPWLWPVVIGVVVVVGLFAWMRK